MKKIADGICLEFEEAKTVRCFERKARLLFRLRHNYALTPVTCKPQTWYNCTVKFRQEMAGYFKEEIHSLKFRLVGSLENRLNIIT